MAGYGNFNLNKKRKGKKLIIAVVCIVVLIIAAVFYIGITAGSSGEEMERISAAVEENTQLKIQINELNDQIEKMQEAIDNLHAELEARPTIAPTPYAMQGEVMPTETPAAAISPRAGR